MDGKRLLAWSDLHDRRQGRPGARWVIAGVLGVGLGAEVARRGGWFAGAAPSSSLVVAIALLGFLPAMLAAPYSMFWRADAALLARLPLPGAALWYATVARSIRAAAMAGVAVAPSMVVVAISDGDLAVRAVALVAAIALATVGLVPAVTLGAAHLVASGKARDLAAAVGGGEVPIGSTAALGGFPGAVIAGVVLAAIYAAPWVDGRPDPTGPLALTLVVAASVIGLAVATAGAPRIVPRAMREIAALDRQVHAHLEIDPITPVERRVKASLGGAAASTYDRMARLVRRRYPLVVFAGFATALTYIVIGAVGPTELVAWLAVTAIAQGALVSWLDRALRRSPLELARLSATLPVTPRDVAAARRAYIVGWCSVWTVTPALIAIALCGRPLAAAIAIAVGWAGAVGGTRWS